MNGSLTPKTNSSRNISQWFTLPKPIRRVFDSFPLITVAENHLPQRAVRKTPEHVLYIFATSQDTSRSNLSCNPACLRWQTFLIINEIDFSVRASNNHASPSGSLPFLLPRRAPLGSQRLPVTSSKIQRWISSQDREEGESKNELELYTALVDQNIRSAWLFYLYLDESNFSAVATPLYITISSSNILVQKAIAAQLRFAARDELLKSRSIIDEEDILDAANKAFESLSTLLGTKVFFSDSTKPGLFDASLFAYSHLLLSESLPWQNQTLRDILSKYSNLVEHRDRLLKICLMK